MSTFASELDRYLHIRRSLGSDLRTTERTLRRFVAFADQEEARYLSTALFLRWQATCGRANQPTRARRLSMVRLFAQWLHGLDPGHEVPPPTLIPSSARRTPPYIYSEADIQRILEAAAALPSLLGLRALTYSTLFGLLAVTGLRISEALALNVGDVDLDLGVLTLQRAKGGKTRMLPLTASTTAHLTTYSQERDRLLGARPIAFFVAEHGARPTEWSARYNFAVVCQHIGLRPAQKYYRYGRGPRIHDLRHTFAVRTLVAWYRTGQDPAQEMLRLTTYLGHASLASTYWYIEAVPELLALASHRATTALEEEDQA